MSKWLQSVLALCAIAVTAAICLLCWQTATQEQAIGDAATALTRQLNAMPDLAPTVQKLNQTVDAINAPCVGFHGSTTCGPIAQLSQTAKNVGIVAGLSAQQVKQSGVLIDSAAQAVQKVSTDLSGTAQAATGTLNAATGTLTTIQTQAGPLMVSDGVPQATEALRLILLGAQPLPRTESVLPKKRNVPTPLASKSMPTHGAQP